VNRIFWGPVGAPHNLGTNLARNFFGTVYLPNDGNRPTGDVNLHYGILYGGKELHERCRAEKTHFIHVDHGFWGRTDDLNSTEKGHFRFSLNSQANVLRVPPTGADHVRLKMFEKAGLVDLQPRKKGGKWVVYQSPSQYMRDYWKLPEDFDETCMRALRRKHTFVRVHEKGEPLDLKDVKLFASFNSAAGIRALELGIDAMMTWHTNVWPFEDLSDAEFERLRRAMFAYMSGRTFSFAEIKNGTAFFHMTRNGELP
jgi:hypothetical protein